MKQVATANLQRADCQNSASRDALARRAILPACSG